MNEVSGQFDPAETCKWTPLCFNEIFRRWPNAHRPVFYRSLGFRVAQRETENCGPDRGQGRRRIKRLHTRSQSWNPKSFPYLRFLLMLSNPSLFLQLVVGLLVCLFTPFTLYFFYKNHVYKNVEAQIPENLRTC